MTMCASNKCCSTARQMPKTAKFDRIFLGQDTDLTSKKGTRKNMRFRAVARPGARTSAAVKAAQRLNRSSGILAGSVLLDSAVEHYRGGFYNPAMATPIATSLISLLASLHGHGDSMQARHRLRDAVFGLCAFTGLIGTGFHFYNITKKPGGFSWQNLFYSGPLGAPTAIGLSGLFGLLAERVRDTPPASRPDIAWPARRTDGRLRHRAKPARNDGRGRSSAFPRRLSQSGNVSTGHGATGGGCADRQCGPRTFPP